MTTPARRGEYPNIATSHFTEVAVYTGILRATAELLELLGEFFSGADSAVRTQLGQFIASRQPDLGLPAIATAITLHELTEAADLLHTLANPSTENVHGDNDVTSATDQPTRE